LQQRGDDDDYWGDDDGLGGWSKFMGEERSGKSDAIRKGRERASRVDDESVATLAKRAPARTGGPSGGTGEVKTAYKRGGPRPWEVARAAREAEAASDPGNYSRADADADASDMNSGSAFTRAGLPAHMVNAMRAAGLKRTTEIQRLAIPSLVAGEDVVILAETGSGKTFAYALPMIAAVGAPGRGGTKVQGRCCPSMIVLVPNVELGRQVAYMAELAAEWVHTGEYPKPAVFSLLGKDKKLLKPTAPSARGAAKTAAIKRKVQEKAAIRAARVAAREAAESAARGEGATDEEAAASGDAAADLAGSRAASDVTRKATDGHSVKAGKKGSKLAGDMEAIPEFRRAEVLVATPARLLAMMRDGWVLPGRIKHVVVDEADEMLSRGFEREVAAVLETCYQDDGVNKFGGKVQFCFAAATMAEEGPILGAFRRGAENLRWVSTAHFGGLHPQLRQRVREVHGEEGRRRELLRALAEDKTRRALVFCSSPEEADACAEHCNASGYVAMSFHGKTAHRGVALDEFFNGDLPVLACTDLAARGIDFPDLHHVVHYTPAADAATHLHRCGRTARVGQIGPFLVTCLVDRDADDVDEEVAAILRTGR